MITLEEAQKIAKNFLVSDNYDSKFLLETDNNYIYLPFAIVINDGLRTGSSPWVIIVNKTNGQAFKKYACPSEKYLSKRF